MRSHSLLVLGKGYTKPAHFPRCDATWTTLACVNDDPDILNLKNLHVWDCGHDIENTYDVPIINFNDEPTKWRQLISVHGQRFADQYCWMLADVGGDHSPFASVTLFGILLSDEEYQHKLQYITYFLGYLSAKNVGLTICDPSQVLRPSLYGWQGDTK